MASGVWGREEPIGDRDELFGRPVLTHIAHAGRGHHAENPLHDRADAGPRVGLVRWITQRPGFDRFAHARPGIGEAELDHRVVGRNPLALVPDLVPPTQKIVDGQVHKEGVLHDGAEVVVDVHDDGHVTVARQVNADGHVVTVAQHILQLVGAVRRNLVESQQPARQRVVSLRDVAAEALTLHVVVGQQRNHPEQGIRLPQSHAVKRGAELGDGRSRTVLVRESTRVDCRHERAREAEQGNRAGDAQQIVHGGEKVVGQALYRAVDRLRAWRAGHGRPRRVRTVNGTLLARLLRGHPSTVRGVRTGGKARPPLAILKPGPCPVQAQCQVRG